jgi:hypothetical protein
VDRLLYRIGQTPAKGQVCIKKGQSSVLEHVSSQFVPSIPVLNLAKKEWTASKFEMDGLLCQISQTPAKGEVRIKK